MFLETDPDFAETGLKRSSVVRISHLSVVDKGLLLGSLGRLSPEGAAMPVGARDRLNLHPLVDGFQA